MFEFWKYQFCVSWIISFSWKLYVEREMWDMRHLKWKKMVKNKIFSLTLKLCSVCNLLLFSKDKMRQPPRNMSLCIFLYCWHICQHYISFLFYSCGIKAKVVIALFEWTIIFKGGLNQDQRVACCLKHVLWRLCETSVADM